MIGELETTSCFHVIVVKVTYNVLLGRPWIHTTNVVPSTLHHNLKYYKEGSERTIKADENCFTVEESHFAYAKYYQKKKANERQPHERPEMPEMVTLILHSEDNEIAKELHGLTMPLTHLEKVVLTPLKGFVVPVNGQKVQHETMEPKVYDLLGKADYEIMEDKSMGAVST
ncbi:hypothetical protein LIER_05560 [Lithospermum erythrorhizon]|uniref:Uncharacterized protein n=1 Tax=Lithospermum erythrorhizon TaxID=34254 RepID=A0AAV3P0X8_LITER